MGFSGGSVVKNLPAKQEMRVWYLGQECPLEEEMATPSRILTWKILWTGAWLKSMRLQRVRHDLVTEHTCAPMHKHTHNHYAPSSVQFSSVQSLSCVRLFATPWTASTPGLPVHQQLLEFTQTHVHWVGDAIILPHPLSSPFLTFNLSQHQGFSNKSALCIR